MATRKTTTPQGLRLTLPGAPDTPHVIPGVPGLYRPGTPTPVGGDTDVVTLERAREIDADEGVPLGLVDMTVQEADAARAEFARHVDEARGALTTARLEARQTGSTPEEGERLADEAAAITTPNPSTEEAD